MPFIHQLSFYIVRFDSGCLWTRTRNAEPRFYRPLRYQFRSHIHKNRRVLKLSRMSHYISRLIIPASDCLSDNQQCNMCDQQHKAYHQLSLDSGCPVLIVITIRSFVNTIVNADKYAPLNTFLGSCQPIIVLVVTIYLHKK